VSQFVFDFVVDLMLSAGTNQSFFVTRAP